MARSKILNFLSLDYGAFTYTEDEIDAMELAYEAEEQRLKDETNRRAQSIREQTERQYEGSPRKTAFQPDLFDPQD